MISWKSKKQSVVSRSSVKSEYRAIAQFACEIMWIRQLLMEMGIETSVLAKLWCDNQAAMHIASNPVFHEQVKHIEIDCHFVCEKIQLRGDLYRVCKDWRTIKGYIHKTFKWGSSLLSL